MKKLFLLGLILLFCTLFPDTPSKRADYWQTRVDSLKQEIKALEDSDIYPFIEKSLSVSLTTAEETENALRIILAGTSSGTKSVETDNYYEKCFNAAFLKKLSSGYSSNQWSEKTQQFMITDLNLLTDSIFAVHDDFLSSKLIQKFLTQAEQKTCAKELFIRCMVDSYPSLLKEFKNKAAASIAQHKSATGENLTFIKAAREIDKTSSDFDIEARLEIKKVHYDNTITAANLLYLSRKRLNTVKKASIFLNPLKSGNSPERGNYYIENILELNKDFFSFISNNLYSIKSPSATDIEKAGGIRANSDDDYRKFILSADKMRLSALNYPYDSDSFAASAAKEIETIFGNVQSSKKEAALKYADLSKSFILLAKDAEMSSVLDPKRYVLNAKLAGETALSISNIEKTISSVKAPETPGVIYSAYKKKIQSMYSFLRNFEIINRTDRKYMNSGDISEISKAFNESFEVIEKSIKENDKTDKSSADDDIPKDDIMKKCASIEISALTKNIQNSVAIIRDLQYRKGIISEYAALFADFEDSARSGIFTDTLKDFSDKKSILPFIKNYDSSKFKSEKRANDYLLKNLDSDNARIKQISDYYTRNKAAERISFDKDIKAIRSQSSIRKIGAFPVNDSNLDVTDRKVSAYIMQIIERKKWERGTPESLPDIKYSIDTADISLMIPEGWQRDEDREESSLAYFVNKSDSSNFRVYSELNGKHSAVENFERWSQKLRYKTVKSGLKKINGRDVYFRICEKFPGKVVKAYAFEKNNSIIIISGEIAKEKYRFFSSRIDSAMDSVKDKAGD